MRDCDFEFKQKVIKSGYDFASVAKEFQLLGQPHCTLESCRARFASLCSNPAPASSNLPSLASLLSAASASKPTATAAPPDTSPSLTVAEAFTRALQAMGGPLDARDAVNIGIPAPQQITAEYPPEITAAFEGESEYIRHAHESSLPAVDVRLAETDTDAWRADDCLREAEFRKALAAAEVGRSRGDYQPAPASSTSCSHLCNDEAIPDVAVSMFAEPDIEQAKHWAVWMAVLSSENTSAPAKVEVAMNSETMLSTPHATTTTTTLITSRSSRNSRRASPADDREGNISNTASGLHAAAAAPRSALSSYSYGEAVKRINQPRSVPSSASEDDIDDAPYLYYNDSRSISNVN